MTNTTTAYDHLLLELRPRPIRSKLAYRRALGHVERLMSKPVLSRPESEMVELLSTLIEQYEEVEYPTKRGRAKSDSAEKKFRPPPPNGWESPKSCYYLPRNSPLSANCNWQAEGVARREKTRLPVFCWPSANSLAWRKGGVQSRYVVCV